MAVSGPATFRLETALNDPDSARHLIEQINAAGGTVIDELVTLTNAVTVNLSQVVPSGSVVLSVQANLQTTVSGDGSGDDLLAKVGIGTTVDPDKYAITSALTKNSKAKGLADWAVLASDEQIAVRACQSDGSPCTEKFLAGGQVRVRVVYLSVPDLGNA